MAVTLIGLVYYEDDPEKLIFRKVFPSDDDSELDDPQWVTFGCDPDRKAVMRKVAMNSLASEEVMTGTP